MIDGCGFSLAKARAAKVSIIKLIHKSYTVLRGTSPIVAAPKNSTKSTEKLTVS